MSIIKPPLKLSKYWKSEYGDMKYIMKNAIPLEKAKQISKEYNKQLRKKENNK